jgi:hypothetical protein
MVTSLSFDSDCYRSDARGTDGLNAKDEISRNGVVRIRVAVVMLVIPLNVEKGSEVELIRIVRAPPKAQKLANGNIGLLGNYGQTPVTAIRWLAERPDPTLDLVSLIELVGIKIVYFNAHN